MPWIPVLPPNEKASLRRISLAVFLIAAVAVLVRLPYLDAPFERDEGEYAYIGWLIHQGGLPYRDVFDQKSPGVFYIYAMILRLFGNSTIAVHSVLAAWVASTSVALYLLGRRWIGEKTGLLAALIFALLSVDPSVLGFTANTELFMVLPIVLAAYSILEWHGRRLTRSLIAAGVWMGAAILMKQVALFEAFFFGLVLLTWEKRNGRIFGLYLFSAALLPILTSLYFMAIGAGSEYFDSTVFYNLYYTTAIPFNDRVHFFWVFFGKILRSQWPIWAFAGAAIFMIRRLDKGWFLLGWAVFSFIGIASGGGLFVSHYFVQLLPALSLLAAAGMARIWTIAGTTMPRIFRPVAAIGLSAALLYPMWQNKEYMGMSAESFVDTVYPESIFSMAPAIAEYLRDHSDVDETIYILGSEPEILFYAGRRSATRYIFSYPLFDDIRGAEQRQSEAWSEIEKNSPRYIIVSYSRYSLFIRAAIAPSDQPLWRNVKNLAVSAYRPVGCVLRSPSNKMLLAWNDERCDLIPPPYRREIGIWERRSK